MSCHQVKQTVPYYDTNSPNNNCFTANISWLLNGLPKIQTVPHASSYIASVDTTLVPIKLKAR